jgi:hypothetical protein
LSFREMLAGCSFRRASVLPAFTHSAVDPMESTNNPLSRRQDRVPPTRYPRTIPSYHSLSLFSFSIIVIRHTKTAPRQE